VKSYTDELGRACNRCKVYKLWDQFNKGNGPNGRKSHCKACLAEYAKNYKRDPVKTAISKKRYLEKNKEKYRAYFREYQRQKRAQQKLQQPD
jgi:hypothetical protein